MYIRRKVFSSLMDETGEERLFSTTDYEYDENGNACLDERVFSDKNDKGMTTAQKAAIGALATIAAGTGAVVGAKYGGKALVNKAAKIEKAAMSSADGINSDAMTKAAKLTKVGKALQVPADTFVAGAKATGKDVQKAGKWAVDEVKAAGTKLKGVFKKAPKDAKAVAGDATKAAAK